MSLIMSHEMLLPRMPIRVIYTSKWMDWSTREEDGKGIYVPRFKTGERRIVATDAYDIRSVFLRIKSEEGGLRFLQRTHCFWEGKRQEGRKNRMSFSDIADLKSLIREATKTPTDEWPVLRRKYQRSWLEALMTKPTPTLEWADKYPSAIVKIEENSDFPLLATIGALTKIERQCNRQQRICAREDCGVVFTPAERRQIYCEPKCAHLMAVRNSRSRAAERAEPKEAK